jgi:hypothetical protein
VFPVDVATKEAPLMTVFPVANPNDNKMVKRLNKLFVVKKQGLKRSYFTTKINYCLSLYKTRTNFAYKNISQGYN